MYSPYNHNAQGREHAFFSVPWLCWMQESYQSILLLFKVMSISSSSICHSSPCHLTFPWFIWILYYRFLVWTKMESVYFLLVPIFSPTRNNLFFFIASFYIRSIVFILIIICLLSWGGKGHWIWVNMISSVTYLSYFRFIVLISVNRMVMSVNMIALTLILLLAKYKLLTDSLRFYVNSIS